MQVLRDHAAIYTGPGTNNVIAGNLIQHVGGHANDGTDGRDWFRFAIYCDEYTTGYYIYNNVTLDVPRPLMIHGGGNHVITNNFFIDTSDIVRLTFGNVPANNIVFSGNICYSLTNLYVEYSLGQDVNNSNAVVDWSSDIFYSGIGGASGITGIPANAVRLDPQFTSLSPSNVSFQTGSVAPGLGIVPLYVNGIGAVGPSSVPAPTNLRRRTP